MKPHKISANLDNSLLPIQKCHLNVCLNELKFCKVSRNPKLNSCWKFQLSILTNKKVLFLRYILSVPCTMESSFFSQQMAPWRPNFPHQRLCFLLPPSFLTTKKFHFWAKREAKYILSSTIWTWYFQALFFLIGHRILERELTLNIFDI